MRNWYVALSLCLRGQYPAGAALARTAIESLARTLLQCQTDGAAEAWFGDERATFTELLRDADPSEVLLARWRDLSEIAHGKTGAGALVVDSGILLLGTCFDAPAFWKLVGVLDSVLVRFLTFARDDRGGDLEMDDGTRRLPGDL